MFTESERIDAYSVRSLMKRLLKLEVNVSSATEMTVKPPGGISIPFGVQ